MDSEGGIDWYTVSKMSCQNLNLYKFNEIISVTHPEQNIDKVSLQYRKKLLILFQKASKKIKEQTPHFMASHHQLQMKRNFVSDQLAQIENQAQTNFKEFTNLKFILNEKKRLKAKLKQKLEKKGFHQSKKVYCCTVCNREDFQTVDAYKTHMFIEHRENNEKNNQSSQQMNELKDLLMTMKDKQIEMMSMFLKASKEFQTQKLEKQYDKEYNKFMQISNTKTDESKQQEEPIQLKAESQFLFFRKSQQFRREMQQDQEFRRKLSKQKALKQQSLHHQFYQPGDYYNVFGAIAENKSEHIQQRRSPMKIEDSAAKSYSYYDPNEVISKFLKQHQSISRDSRYSLVQNTPKPKIQFKQEKTLRQNQYVPSSISDRLRLINKQNARNNPQYETMFSTKRKFHEENGYVFNSGPLIDDKGGDSDYQDYFGKNKNLNISIQDEEIKLSFANLNKSNLPASKQSFHLSKLLSPKDNSNNSLLGDKESKQKSSVIVDLSDSFSKRDFQISKDDDTINLSDLKFSKLEKKKEEEKLNIYKIEDKIQGNRNISSRQNFTKNKEILIKPLQKNSYTQKNDIEILKQYQKPIVTPLREQNYRFTQQGTYTKNFIKTDERANVLMINRPNLNNENSLGLLNQFLKDEFKGQRKQSFQKKQPTKSRQLDQFIQK